MNVHVCSTRLHLCLAAAAALLASGPAAAVTLDEWGTDVSVRTASCSSFCQDISRGSTTGGQNELTAEGDITDTRGTSRALAELDSGPGINIPQLKAEGRSNSTGSGSGLTQALGVDAYTYTGPGTATFNLDIMVDGVVFDPTPLDRDTFIEAKVYIFAPENFFFTSDLSTLIFEAGAEVITSTELRLDPGDTSLSDTLSFDLSNGESVYLWALLEAEGQREESFANAFDTLDLAFQDSSGLVAASAIPEPGTFALLGLGLLGLACQRGRSSR